MTKLPCCVFGVCAMWTMGAPVPCHGAEYARAKTTQEGEVERPAAMLAEERQRLRQALLRGDAAYFESIPKPELAALNAGGTYSTIHDTCLANYDRLPQCFRALAGALESRTSYGIVGREMLYLNAEKILRSDGTSEAVAALHARLDQLLAKRDDPRFRRRYAAELKSRFAPLPSPSSRASETRKKGLTPAALVENRRLIRVSSIGERRATAYTMTSLFCRHGDELYASWMDKPTTNCLGVLDGDAGRVFVACVLGRPSDDHGNAAVVRDTKGRIHSVVGAHHGTLLHRMAEDPDKPHVWRDLAEVGAKATHPCLVCDRRGVLHLVYRSSSENPWLLCYQRYGADGVWSKPMPLLRAAKTWYVTWTNSLVVAPDNTLHLVFAATRYDARARTTYYGASHVYSRDGGQTWQQYGGKPLSLPAPVEELATIDDPSEAASRTVADEEAESYQGTENEKAPTTRQMLLSGAVVDEKNRPWVVVHNTIAKTASLYCGEQGTWRLKADLTKSVQQILPQWVTAEQSTLSRHACGWFEAVLPIVPLKRRSPRDFVGWQSNELELVRILMDSEGHVLGSKLVLPANPKKATWLPNLEKWDWNHPFDHPALLFSSGVSDPPLRQATSSVSKKECVMEVWLDTAE